MIFFLYVYISIPFFLMWRYIIEIDSNFGICLQLEWSFSFIISTFDSVMFRVIVICLTSKHNIYHERCVKISKNILTLTETKQTPLRFLMKKSGEWTSFLFRCITFHLYAWPCSILWLGSRVTVVNLNCCLLLTHICICLCTFM